LPTLENVKVKAINEKDLMEIVGRIGTITHPGVANKVMELSKREYAVMTLRCRK